MDQGAGQMLPEKLNDDLLDILGRPNFACISIARILKASGWDIPPKAEAEQASVIFFTLKHWIADPANWRANAGAELQALENGLAIQRKGCGE